MLVLLHRLRVELGDAVGHVLHRPLHARNVAHHVLLLELELGQRLLGAELALLEQRERLLRLLDADRLLAQKLLLLGQHLLHARSGALAVLEQLLRVRERRASGLHGLGLLFELQLVVVVLRAPARELRRCALHLGLELVYRVADRGQARGPVDHAVARRADVAVHRVHALLDVAVLVDHARQLRLLLAQPLPALRDQRPHAHILLAGLRNALVALADGLQALLPLPDQVLTLLVQGAEVVRALVELDLLARCLCGLGLQLAAPGYQLRRQPLELPRQVFYLLLVRTRVLLQREVVLLLLASRSGPLVELLLLPVHGLAEALELLGPLVDGGLHAAELLLDPLRLALQRAHFLPHAAHCTICELLQVLLGLDFLVLAL